MQHLEKKHGSLADCSALIFKRKAEIVKKKLDLIFVDLANKKRYCH
jgi:hypothetical protein